VTLRKICFKCGREFTCEGNCSFAFKNNIDSCKCFICIAKGESGKMPLTREYLESIAYAVCDLRARRKKFKELIKYINEVVSEKVIFS